MRDLVDEILSTLRHNKLRMALTGFAISWGIFMLIVLLSMATGVSNAFNDNLADFDYNTMTIYGGYTEKAYKGLGEGREIALKEQDATRIHENNKAQVTSVSTSLQGDAEISTQKDYISGYYNGVEPGAAKKDGIKIIKGRFINDLDVSQHRRVMVLGSKNANVLFGDKNPVGQLVKMGDLTFTVIGVHYHQWMQSSYIPYSTAKGLKSGTDSVESITASVRNLKTEEDGSAAENELRKTLARAHEFDPDDQGALWIRNSFVDHLRMQGALNGLQLAVWLIGILTLLSGIVGVSNIMFVSVKERTHEIGVRRALGARPNAILKQIILESVAITTIFGYIGIVAGVAFSQLVSFFIGETEFLRNPTIPLSICFEVTLVLVIAGCLAGFFPAKRALKIKPVEALSEE